MLKCNTLYTLNRKKQAQRNVAKLLNLTKCKKLKFTPEQASKAQRGSRGTALLFKRLTFVGVS
jgi:hypothetical protein